MSVPVVFTTPDGRGSPAHPLLLALYYTCPGLVQSLADNKNKAYGTLSKAVDEAWRSLSGKHGDASAIWNLIGEDRLAPAECVELFNQMCDLFDAECEDAAQYSLGVEQRMSVESGARVKKGLPVFGYNVVLAIPIKGIPGLKALTVSALLESNFKMETIDYTFPDDDESVEAIKANKLCGDLKQGLVIHLQRYRYDFDLGAKAKIYDRIEFPKTLSGKELSKYAEPGSPSQAAMASCSMELAAVVTHGDLDGYGLLLRTGEGNNAIWWRCCQAGSNVPMETSIESVFGGEDADQELAYMLFYKVVGGKGLSKRSSIKLAGTELRKVMASDADKRASLKDADKRASLKDAAGAAGKGGGCCTVV